MMAQRILVHHPHTTTSPPSFRAHLESTQHEHMADTYDGAVEGLLHYIGRLGWSSTRTEFEIIDLDASARVPPSLDSIKPPIYVHHEDGAGSRWVAEPSGAPHLAGYGPTAEEAMAACEEMLKLHGFDHTFGDPIYC